MADQEFVTAPMLTTIARGIVVDRPIGEAAPPDVGPLGGVSVGPGNIPSVGGVIHVAVHERDGSTVMVTFGAASFREFAIAMNAAAERVMSGEFDQPETSQ